MFYIGRSKLRILIDPLSVHLDASHQLIHEQVALATVLHYLPAIGENKLEVEIIFPEFLWNGSWRENYYSFIPGDINLEGPKNIRIIKKREDVSSSAREKAEEVKQYLETKKGNYLKLPKISLKDPSTLVKSIEDGTLLTYRDADYLYKHGYMELIDLYCQYRCDLLLTSNRVLQAEKEVLKNKFRIFITNYPEIFEEVETFLKGHHIYITHIDPIYGLDVATFYPMTDSKLQRYLELCNRIITMKKDSKMEEYFRVMFYHRYSFMKYAVDQINFHLFQAERLEDEDLRSKHYFLASYHLNSFYFQLWGYLDNLAWVFNYLYELGFDQKTAIKVSFSNKEYRKRLRIKASQVNALLEDSEVKRWLLNLAVKRHPAAHREPLFMSRLYDQRDMSLISEKIVMVDTKKGKGLFEAVDHLKYDLDQLDKFMSKVCELFNVSIKQ